VVARLVASPERLAAAGATLKLPLDSNADQARQLGKAFEEEASKRLGIKER